MEKIGIVGLGLMGGSLAKAIKKNDSTIEIVGIDERREAVDTAITGKIIDSDKLDDIRDCDIVVICLYPQDTVNFIRDNAKLFKENAVVADFCGIKKGIVYYIEYILSGENRHDLVYLSCHPMAGRECWGFENSVENLYEGKSFLVAKTPNCKAWGIEVITKFAQLIGCSRTVMTTPEQHDQIIALTSQLAHIVSSAYIKSPTAQYADGFTGGSFADMTRVASLNENMWTELFLQNREFLLNEIDIFEKNLDEFRYAIKGNDARRLKELLAKGRERREKLNQMNIEK